MAAFTQNLSAGYLVKHVTSHSIRSYIISDAALRNDMLTERSTSLQEDANELLSLLLESQKTNAPTDRERVETLIDTLAEAHIEFDPNICLNGPLFCALYQKGPIPFWEKYSVNFGQEKNNLKGQRYTKRADNDDKLDVLNYAQLLGASITIEASGVFKQSTRVGVQTEAMEGIDSDNSNPLQFLADILKRTPIPMEKKAAPTKSLKCPVDFTGSVQSGKINIFGKTISLDIKGTGYLKVLYADPSMRIFTTPKDSTNDKWAEKSGLTVVQVRVDLIDDTFMLK